MIPNDRYSAIFHYRGYTIGLSAMYDCWAIMDRNGKLVKEPYWNTTGEAREAIDSGEALA